METKIIVASHKNLELNFPEGYYLTQVGTALSSEKFEGYYHDDEGINISTKNPFYNELTALYWAWKNLEYDNLGLVHYRRVFSRSAKKDASNALSIEQINALFHQGYDVILPKKRHYFIETNYSHYIHAHKKEPIELLRKIIADKYPNYLASYDKIVMKKTSAHMFNIFVMKKSVLDNYLKWLFEVLENVEADIQPKLADWSTYEQRVYGFLSELLLDVWLDTNKINYVEVPVKFLEKQNWIVKIAKFLARKIGIMKHA